METKQNLFRKVENKKAIFFNGLLTAAFSPNTEKSNLHLADDDSYTFLFKFECIGKHKNIINIKKNIVFNKFKNVHIFKELPCIRVLR